MEILDLDKLRIVSIPQAVRAVATVTNLLTKKQGKMVSIPQAVRAVATSKLHQYLLDHY